MKKSKLSLGLITCLLSVGSLAGCEKQIKSSKEGVLFSYSVDGSTEKIPVTADEILGDYFNDSTKYQAIFDTINSVIVRNYFKKERTPVNYHGQTIQLGLAQMEKINHDAQEKVDEDKDTAKTNKEANGTTYKKEFEAILESKGVKTEEELFNKYVEELQKEQFEKNFYTYFIDEIKEGGQATVTYKDSEGTAHKMWDGYFDQEVPYHVSHILVKLEDSSGTNYSNGTISKDNAIKLADVVDALGAPESATYNESFGTIAYSYSEDTGSAKSYGDLGIMDYSTSYVNEFKLGVYAYENFYYKKDVTTSRAKGSPVDLVTDKDEDGSVFARYESAVKGAFGSTVEVPTIKKEVFDEIRKYADKETDDTADKKPVLEGSTLVMPRNIVYNKYLNRHLVAFIEGKEGDALNKATTKKTVGYIKYGSETKLGSVGPVLSAKVAGEWTPILVARAGSDYQGIHFIVINRSAFEEGAHQETPTVHPVKKADYYTTFYPEQTYYPDVNGKTYINFSSNDSSKTKKRAEEFVSKLKSFDSDKLSKYIFRKYMEEEKIKISDKDLSDALTKWIDTSIEKKVEERKETWEKTWTEYLDNLARQNSERNKLVPEVCKLFYKYGNSSESLDSLKDELGLKAADITAIKELLVEYGLVPAGKTVDEVFEELAVSSYYKKEGGLCNDGKDHL